MRRLEGTSSDRQTTTEQTNRFDMDTMVGYILFVGVLLSLTLIVTGLVWHWALVGHLQFEYSVTAMNLFQFMLADVQHLLSGAIQPQLAISTGIAVLMLTPYVRVLTSVLYFALIEHNWKYMLFTAFVLGVLTYGLFLR
jgi:uncharacterized membrane protein